MDDDDMPSGLGKPFSTEEYIAIFEKSLQFFRQADRLQAAKHEENGYELNFRLVRMEAELRQIARFMQRGLVQK